MSDATYTIGDLAEAVNRSETTIRVWCREERLPTNLRPARIGAKGWRRWTESQVEQIKQWMIDTRMFPGGGLEHYDPTPQEQADVLDRLRAAKRAA